MSGDHSAIPVIDVSPLVAQSGTDAVASEIAEACRNHGFFYVVGHGVDQGLIDQLDGLSHDFFAQQLEAKLAIRMALGGRAWRGYFPIGAELTSGQPDGKEGLYFGAELPEDHPKVKTRTPLYGRNLFPDISGFREVVLDYMASLTELGHILMEGMALSLGLESAYFRDRYTDDPLILFRIFHYPPLQDSESVWSVGEHTDYGLLTILHQDNTGGLQVKTGSSWIDAPPILGSFVCNIGDMLDRMTRGLYRSTPHRVRNEGNSGRISFPFFFDPNFDAEVHAIDSDLIVADDKNSRWDSASVHEFNGTYGEYLLNKVLKVFPELGQSEL